MKNLIKSGSWIFIFFFITIQLQAQTGIEIHLSYKVVLNPSNGLRPAGLTDTDIENAVSSMNNLMENYGRCYQFVLDEIVDVGALGGFTSGPSQWYETDFLDPVNGQIWKSDMETEAKADPDYFWETDAINVYMVTGICGGQCSLPSDGDEIIVIGDCAANDEEVHLHEIGHYFSLCHTQGCPCGNCDSSSTGECNTVPGDDGLDDTLPDLECWDQDAIAEFSFAGTPYANLTVDQQAEVDDVFLNIMSYHSNLSRLTERQMDQWADGMDDDPTRRAVRSGDSWFVKTSGANGDGTAADPFNATVEGANAANVNGGDIIYFRQGTHIISVPLVIDIPVTLSATREGTAIIGN